ncbi:MAG: BMP family ABC transporter substrate-binding protein [Bacillota bacterium]|nr:BMP family ABC transporter substrate-binding protein [Bacillota bacterium]
MKKLLALITVMIMALCMTACGDDKQASDEDAGKTEVSLIISGDIDDGGFNQVTWESIEAFCGENDLTCGHYKVKSADEANIIGTVDKAKSHDGKLIIFAGSTFDEAVYKLQNDSNYKGMYFYMIDGVPYNEDEGYELSKNSIGVLFAEEEAGYLAGYAAVMDGYTDLGFLGGEDVPSVKRYGYGFLQGISAASTEQGLQKKINVHYGYAGTFKASDDVEKKAASWYKDGVQVIFSCGGGIVKSVINAAERSNGKIIGVDVDQSGLSDTVITSALKGIDAAIEDVLKEYKRGNFIGNNVFNYTANNGGVGLVMDNARFKSFSQEQYDEVFSQIKNGQIKIKKDTEVKNIKDLVAKNIKIIK